MTRRDCKQSAEPTQPTQPCVSSSGIALARAKESFLHKLRPVSRRCHVVMPLLAHAKGRVATQLGSGATAGDAAQSWLCAIIAAGALVSILATRLGWWWLDPIIKLGIAALAVREGREAWAGEICADCALIDPLAPSDGPRTTSSCGSVRSDGFGAGA